MNVRKHSLKQRAAYYEAMIEANNYYGRNLESSNNSQVLLSVKAAISEVQQQLNIPLEKREKDIDKIVSKLNLK